MKQNLRFSTIPVFVGYSSASFITFCSTGPTAYSFQYTTRKANHTYNIMSGKNKNE